MQKKIEEGMNENLLEILQGRDARAKRQTELLQQFSAQTLVCFTMNIAGPNKRSSLIDKAFEEGIARLEDRLRLNHFNIEYFEKASPKSGNEAYFIIQKNAIEVKKVACDLEQYHELGRLFDIDVFDANGIKIVREACDLARRKCLICNSDAAICARSRAHGIDVVICETNRILWRYFSAEYADKIAEVALKAILNEVCVTPKPGLVDCANSGAHCDMDIFSFMNSAAALTKYFRKTAQFGANFTGEPSEILRQIRPLGIEAENKMYTATNGANCHMGAIYSLGILCAASGYLYANCAKTTTEVDPVISIDEVVKIAAEIAQNEGDFGAQAEAKSGFESVKKWALPMLQKCLNDGYTWNNSCALALFSLMANIEDRNIIARGGIKEAKKKREKAQKMLEKAQKMSENEVVFLLKRLDAEYIGQNLSPGGAADLLAISIFFHYMERMQM